jgi:ATPase subunit of ABC transporter with duplicated ATPase domains
MLVLFAFACKHLTTWCASQMLLQVEDMSFGYKKDRPLFTKVSIHCDLKSRIGCKRNRCAAISRSRLRADADPCLLVGVFVSASVLGMNGSGKSTLLKLCRHQLDCAAGKVNSVSRLGLAFSLPIC